MATGESLFLHREDLGLIDLNPLLASDSGVQALSGVTGFGLPPVEAFYRTGAGDGASYQGQRFGPRDIDLPLCVVGSSPDALREQFDLLGRYLSDECQLIWQGAADQPANVAWMVKVRRVGGGEYIYGEDTDGSYTLRTVITLRSESPYWESLSATLGGTLWGDEIGQLLELDESKLGSAPSSWEVGVRGPMRDVRVYAGQVEQMLPSDSLSNLGGTSATFDDGWSVLGGGSLLWSGSQSRTNLPRIESGDSFTRVISRASEDGPSITNFPGVTGGKEYFVRLEVYAQSIDSTENSSGRVAYLALRTPAPNGNYAPAAPGSANLSLVNLKSRSMSSGDTVVLEGVFTVPPGATGLLATIIIATTDGQALSSRDGSIIAVTGPLQFFEVPKQVLSYPGYMGAESVIFDMTEAQATRGDGANVFHEIGPDPTWGPLDRSATDILVTADRSSTKFEDAHAAGIRNHVTNPKVAVDTAGWDLAYWVRDENAATGETYLSPSDQYIPETAGHSGTYASTVVSNLTPGRSYDLLALIRQHSEQWEGQWIYSRTAGRELTFSVHGANGPLAIQEDRGSSDFHRQVRIPFTADDVTATVIVYARTGGTTSNGIKQDRYTALSNFAVVPSGEEYFDGDTPDEGDTAYTWLGTAHDSESGKAVASYGNPYTQVSVTPRSWWVV